MYQLWLEYSEGKSAESKLAKQLDKRNNEYFLSKKFNGGPGAEYAS